MATRLTVLLCHCAPLHPTSHGFKLIDTLLGVTLADLAQGFVLVSACSDVLGM